MDAQICFSGMEPPEFREMGFLRSIEQQMKSAVAAKEGDPTQLKIKPLKSGYSSVSYGSDVVFRLHLRGKSDYVSIPGKYKDIVCALWDPVGLEIKSNFIRIRIDRPLNDYANLLIALAESSVATRKEWDCCSRYLACSDAKKCVYPDPQFAMACGYRKILASGKIFYGPNRNV